MLDLVAESRTEPVTPRRTREKARSLRPFVVAAISCLGVLTGEGTSGAGSLKGVIQLPASFRPPNDSVGSPVFWRLPNPYVPLGPPLVDPRRSMLVALEGPAAGEAPDRPAVIELVNSRAEPPMLAVEPGTKVLFRNLDPVMHIIEPVPGAPPFIQTRSIAPADEFGHTFEKAGTFKLRCSEFPHVRATVLVTDQPRTALPDQNGAFEFPDLPQDKFLLRVWYEGKWIHSQTVQVRGRTTVEVRLPASNHPTR